MCRGRYGRGRGGRHTYVGIGVVVRAAAWMGSSCARRCSGAGGGLMR
uniref:Uncharacterized protein n=1 Tax=Arundo donax TaxID=35708 RepID=A0A0A9ACT9_ARUDO